MGTARTRSLPFLSIAPPLQLVRDLAGPPHFRGVLPLEKPAEGALHPRGGKVGGDGAELATAVPPDALCLAVQDRDRKSTRLNSSHTVISYAVFCLEKKISTSYT